MTENKTLSTQSLTPLQRILPPDYIHHLCSYTCSGDGSEFGAAFRYQFRLTLKLEAELLQWLSRFQEQSGKSTPEDLVGSKEPKQDLSNSSLSSLTYGIIKPDTSNADVGRATNGEIGTHTSQTSAGTPSLLVEELIQVFDSVRDKVLNDPHTFTLPVQRFISHYENIKSDSALASALSVFGKRTCRWTSLRKPAAGGNGTLSTGRLLKRIRPEHDYPSWTKKRIRSQSLELCMDQSMTQNREENKA
ncbi:hypothetical protein KOW79_022369 [Hemibagrus wyckioides]|uniref:Uncharacterized protein n=1 Tax=Hemibagrus wyckioides TaxID=337641 RepID=A0A9D3N2V6_9TELE|nr:hypothetical protein KOW79_022369 [Hemibagrus wyckioides]